MIRLPIPGAMYGDALVSGARVDLIPGSHLETHQGHLALPEGETFGVIYPRVSDVIGFQFAGVNHNTDTMAWWYQDHWTFGKPIVGISPVIFDHQGHLHLNDGSAGSQGYRYVDDAGRLVTGDATYYDPAHNLSEYTIAGDVRIGQSHDDNKDHCLVFIDGALRMLEPGPCRFIRVDRQGDRFAITICKFTEKQVVHVWASRAELAQLPLYVAPAPVPTPPPVPVPVPPAPQPVPNPGTNVPEMSTSKIWFCPDIASTDFLDLFAHPEQWTQARSKVGVFQFYAQQITSYVPVVGPNTYEALLAVDAFRKLASWGIAIAVETGVVKPGDCQAQGHLNELPTLIDRIHAAGGTLAYLAMDEPLNGAKDGCPQSLEQTADAVAAFIKAGEDRGVEVGWIEGWPGVDLETQRVFLKLLDERGQLPRFWRLDIDWRAAAQKKLPVADYIAGVRTIAGDYGMPVHIIVTGYDHATDGLYVDDALDAMHALDDIWAALIAAPDAVVVQSWARRPGAALQDLPKNLPEAADSHTALVSHVAEVFA